MFHPNETVRGVKMQEKLKISGMHCASCEKIIGMAVGEVAGAKMISISHKNGEAVVDAKGKAVLEAVKKAIAAEGYKVQ